jgi:hypothetical protein
MWIYSHFYVAVKTGVRPLADHLNQSVPDRIVMDVIHVGSHVPIVLNLVFPETALPYSPLALRDSSGRPPFVGESGAWETRFDQTPPRREVRIPLGQGPYATQVVGSTTTASRRKGRLART